MLSIQEIAFVCHSSSLELWLILTYVDSFFMFESLIGVLQLDSGFKSFDVMEFQINHAGEYIQIFWYLAFVDQVMLHLYYEVTIPFYFQSVTSIVLVLNLILLVVTIYQFFQIYHGFILCSTNYILISLCSGSYSFVNIPNHRSISYYPLVFYALRRDQFSAVKYSGALAFVKLFILWFLSIAFLFVFTFVILPRDNSLFLLFD